MTIKYHPNLRHLVAQVGIFSSGLAISSSAPGFAPVGTSVGFLCSVTIYSGAQPTATQVAAGWSGYNSAQPNFLLHYPLNTIGWAKTSYDNAFMSITSFGTAQNAVNSGTVSWGIIWCADGSSVSTASMASGTLPNAYFWVVPVTDMAGTGVIKMGTSVLTAGQPYSIADGQFGATA